MPTPSGRKRLKEAEDNQKAAEAEACLKEKLALEELRLNNNCPQEARPGTEPEWSCLQWGLHSNLQGISSPTSSSLQTLSPPSSPSSKCRTGRRKFKIGLRFPITPTLTSACRNIFSRSSWTQTCGEGMLHLQSTGLPHRHDRQAVLQVRGLTPNLHQETAVL